jgi:hypothetical protein
VTGGAVTVTGGAVTLTGGAVTVTGGAVTVNIASRRSLASRAAAGDRAGLDGANLTVTTKWIKPHATGGAGFTHVTVHNTVRTGGTIYIYIRIYVYIYIYVCIYVCIHVYISRCMYHGAVPLARRAALDSRTVGRTARTTPVAVLVLTVLCTVIYIHVYIHTYVYVCIFYVYTYIHTYIYIYIYIRVRRCVCMDEAPPVTGSVLTLLCTVICR